MTTEEMTLVVLAGGDSGRMGRDKALMDLGGRPVLAHALDTLSPLFREKLLVSNAPEAYARFDLPIVPDVFPGKGALAGIHAGLSASRTSHAFVLACDMPFVRAELVRYLASLADGRDCVIPIVRGRTQPLHAVYSRFCLPPMEEALRADRRKVVAFLDEVSAAFVTEAECARHDPGLWSVFDLDTPSDAVVAQDHLPPA